MSKKILIIVVLLIIAGIGLGLLIGGYFGGVLCQQEKNKPLKNAIDPLNCLGSSKIISGIIADGEVTKISGRTVTLSHETENFSITIKENFKIYSYASGVTSESSFEEIKVGDNLNVSVKVLSDGQIEVLGVLILKN